MSELECFDDGYHWVVHRKGHTVATFTAEADARAYAASQWEPGRWWRVISPDDSLWCETSSEEEARNAMREGDRLYREWLREGSVWVPDGSDVSMTTFPSDG